jgi:outer membrane cobalamin receptor
VANLVNIPIDNIEKIEIVRGGTSALYGSDAVGGVINIITKKEADNKIKVKVENGSYIPQKSVKLLEGPVGLVEENEEAQAINLFDTQKISVQYSRKVKNIDVVTSGSFTRAKNAYIWNDDEIIDDQRKRVNSELIGGDLYTGVSIPFETGGLDVTGVFAYNDTGAPGSVDPLDPKFSTDADQQNTSFTGNIHFYTPLFFSDFLSFDSKLFYKYSKLEFQNPLSFQNPTSIDSSHTLHTVGLDYVQEVSSFDLLSLIYGGSILYDEVKSTDISSRERVSGGIFVEVPLYFFPLVTLTPVVRYDLYSDFQNSLNFKLSGVYNLSDDTSIKASVSKSYRAPTLNDLYWPNDGFSEGNPDLDPETGYAAEVGISMMKERFKVDAFAFTRYVIDGIDWAETAPFFWQPSNVGKAIYPGAEINGNFHFIPRLSLILNYTFIYSFVLEGSTVDYDISDDKRALNVPVHQLGAAIEYRDKKNLTRLEAEYMGKRYADEENTDEIDSFVVLNAHYQRKLSDHFTMFVSGENIFNTVYEVIDGYVMPSLFIRTGLEASY